MDEQNEDEKRKEFILMNAEFDTRPKNDEREFVSAPFGTAQEGVYFGSVGSDECGRPKIIHRECEVCKKKLAERYCQICKKLLCLDCYEIIFPDIRHNPRYQIVCPSCKRIHMGEKSVLQKNKL